MDWQDEGVLIAMRLHGESSAIIEVFTAHHGRHAGVVRGGASRKQAATLQPGTQLAVTWRARLEDQLGSFRVEPLQSRAGLLGDRLGLAGLNAICAMLRVSLPERASHPTLWRATLALLAALEHDPDWPAVYLRWELNLLEELGFGLDLARCAVTGSRDDLAYVSPKTGRAVSREGAGTWADRLFPLPHCLMGQGPASSLEVVQGLAITGHFLARELAEVNSQPLPEARARLLALLASARSVGPEQ
jgi:DNA repair protein RecO (recombination protein O)